MMPTRTTVKQYRQNTLTNMFSSIAWYEKVFDVTYRLEAPHQGGTGKVLMDDARQLMIVLHHHDANQSERFTETRTGLDHIGFLVPTRTDLEVWQVHLEALGVKRAATADRLYTQAPIDDRSFGSLLVFRDPDNIQLEFFAPPQS